MSPVPSPVSLARGDIVREIPPNLLATDPYLLPRPPCPPQDRHNTPPVRLSLILYGDTDAVAQQLRDADRLVLRDVFDDALSPNIVVGELGLHIGGCGDQ